MPAITGIYAVSIAATIGAANGIPAMVAGRGIDITKVIEQAAGTRGA
ncbi:hypothetical protein [Novosphingobium sp. JCM 18896]|nr:hypothetical protein [Novosphingobium sp. JCM 18896]MCW1431911.1 hypothetical protein [Novosphingobium sp. JCM 18896]